MVVSDSWHGDMETLPLFPFTRVLYFCWLPQQVREQRVGFLVMWDVWTLICSDRVTHDARNYSVHDSNLNLIKRGWSHTCHSASLGIDKVTWYYFRLLLWQPFKRHIGHNMCARLLTARTGCQWTSMKPIWMWFSPVNGRGMNPYEWSNLFMGQVQSPCANADMPRLAGDDTVHYQITGFAVPKRHYYSFEILHIWIKGIQCGYAIRSARHTSGGRRPLPIVIPVTSVNGKWHICVLHSRMHILISHSFCNHRM